MSPRFIKNLPRTFPSDDGPDDCIGIRKVRGLLKKYRIQPSKRLGQNFLIDKRAIKKIVEAAEIKPTDVILEIGPGLGALTRELSKKAKKVIAVEKDRKMIEILKETFKNSEKVKIIHGDILKIENWKLIENLKLKIENYKVVANLPFYLTAPVIRKFLESPARPKMMVLVVQKEVAQRICASSPTKKLVGDKPPKMSILAVSVQVYSDPKIISYIPGKSFWPRPKVDSAIIKIIPHRTAPHQYLRYGAGLREQFFKIVRSGFSHPRKQLTNNLSKGLEIDKIKTETWLRKNNIQPSQRAETLTVEDWLKLTKSFKKE